MNPLRIGLGLLASLVLATSAVAAGPPTVWTELTGRGAEVRTVVSGACPVLRVDGHMRPMRQRAGPDEAFENRICVATLPATARRVSVAGQPVSLPKARPRRLVILGDTGCRIVIGLVQNCNDHLAGWPFARVAALAAAQKPDLVVHVGDYYYREAPCPPLVDACKGSPHGDRWPTWKAELFDPGAPLLKAAPWVFARGNHEDCRRGGKGWFRLLDAAAEAKSCPADSDLVLVDLGGLRLAVLDSADPDDNRDEPEKAQAFARGLAAIPSDAAPVWLVTHRPLWALSHKFLSIGADGGNVNLRAAARSHGLSGVELILAGHVHNFTSFDFGAARPPELIVGTGGDVMDPRDPSRPIGLDLAVDGQQAKALTTAEFGYFVFDRVGKDWVGAFHDLEDRVIVSCRLHAGRMTCAAANR